MYLSRSLSLCLRVCLTPPPSLSLSLSLSLCLSLLCSSLSSIFLALSDCLVSKTGREYSGSRSETRSGRHCQRWDEQSPHAHSMTDPSRFPDMNLTSAENSCRNPDDDKAGPWCFTTDPDVRREDCGLNLCEGIGPTSAQVAEWP